VERRQFLRRVGAAAAVLTAGCGADADDRRTINPALAGTPTRSPTPEQVAAWSRPVTDAVPPVVLGGRLVVSRGPPDRPRVVGLDPVDGTTVWERRYDAPVQADTDGHRLSVSAEIDSDEPFGTVLDPVDGRLLWETDGVVTLTAETPGRAVAQLWSDDGRGPDQNAVFADIADRDDWRVDWRARGEPRRIDGERVHLTRMAGRVATVEAYTAATGALDWRRGWETSAGIAWLGHHDGVGVVAVGDTVRAVSLADGRTLAETANRFGLDAANAAGDGRLYLSSGLPGAGGGGVLALDTERPRFDWEPFPAAARPVAVRDGPVVQTTDGRQRRVAAYDPEFTRRWRHAGTAVAADGHGVYLTRGERLVALDPAGGVRWTVTPGVGGGRAPTATLREPRTVRARIGPAVVVAGSRGLVSYDPADGAERTRLSRPTPVDRVLPRQWLGETTLGGRVVVVSGGAVHGVPV